MKPPHRLRSSWTALRCVAERSLGERADPWAAQRLHPQLRVQACLVPQLPRGLQHRRRG